ncbi:MAG: hypothetical protein IK005_00755 [Paludibacteraceae bacterium]|nr:hypothetical protein [Paludibacteraceae bacterium]MBR4838988.1 hypothetical protein [Paludibacteraceae bacterium]
MRCYNCGRELPKGTKICVGCGQKVGERQLQADGDLTTSGQTPPVGRKRETSHFHLPWWYGLPLGLAAAALLAFLFLR